MSALPVVMGFRSERDVAADVVAGLLGVRLLARSPSVLARISDLLGVSVADIQDGWQRWGDARWGQPGADVPVRRARPAESPAIRAYVEAKVALDVAEVWPDGDAPGEVTAGEVAKVMESGGTVMEVLSAWGLTGDLRVAVEVDGPEGRSIARPWAAESGGR